MYILKTGTCCFSIFVSLNYFNWLDYSSLKNSGNSEEVDFFIYYKKLQEKYIINPASIQPNTCHAELGPASSACLDSRCCENDSLRDL